MRHTLEQLKAMSDAELSSHWAARRFPFDMAKGCRDCLTLHVTLNDCQDDKHIPLRDAVARLIANEPKPRHEAPILRKHLEELYAIRLFYDHLYPQPTVEEIHSDVLSREIERQKERIEQSYLEMWSGTDREC